MSCALALRTFTPTVYVRCIPSYSSVYMPLICNHFQTFEKKIMKHFVQHGLDTITYLANPSKSEADAEVVSVVTNHGLFNLKVGCARAEIVCAAARLMTSMIRRMTLMQKSSSSTRSVKILKRSSSAKTLKIRTVCACTFLPLAMTKSKSSPLHYY